MDSLTLILRFIGVAQLAIIACLAVRDLRFSLVGYLVAVFCFGVATYLICPVIAVHGDLGLLDVLIYFGCFGNPVFFLLLSQSIFDDRFRLRPAHGALLALVEMLGFWRLAELIYGPWNWGFDTTAASLIAQQFAALGIIVWSLVAAYRGRRIDLVEPRRRFREIFVASCGSYMLVVVASEIQLNGRMATEGLALINVAVIVAFVLVASFWMLRFSDRVFAIAAPGRKPPWEVRAPVDQDLLKSLEAFMSAGGFRQTGLTIGGLADHLQAKEQGLRRMINGELGFRNFNAFLNSYRIREASELLATSGAGRLPILTIAMDLGYGSIGPFNRAFKEATGKTPSEYRASFLLTQNSEATPQR